MSEPLDREIAISRGSDIVGYIEPSTSLHQMDLLSLHPIPFLEGKTHDVSISFSRWI